MDGDESESFSRFKNDVKNTAKNGIVLSGVLAWVDIQTHTTADGVRQQQMASLFTIEEIEEAVEDLWGACGGQDSIIGVMPKRNNVPNKAKNLVDDLFKAFKKLEEQEKKPAILATSVQMRKIRTYNVDVDDSNVTNNDVMERVKMLEECISNQNKIITDLITKFDSMAQSKTNTSNLTVVAGGQQQVHPRTPGIVSAVSGPQQSRLTGMIDQAYNRDIRTPKRRRTGEDEDNSWSAVASRNLQGHPLATGTQGGGHRQDPGQQHTPRTHWRQKSLIANGSCNSNNDDKSFAADICLVAGGVSKNATNDKLTEYLKNKGLNIVNCELLTNPNAIEKVRSLSFKVTIKAEDLEKASDPGIWPYRVAVRKFVTFRRKVFDEFAPNQGNFEGVQPLGHPLTPRPRLEQPQQAHLTAQHNGHGHTTVNNRFDVPGFREGISH